MSVNFHDIVTEKISDNISERENDKIYKMKCGMLSGPDSNEDLSIARSKNTRSRFIINIID